MQRNFIFGLFSGLCGRIWLSRLLKSLSSETIGRRIPVAAMALALTFFASIAQPAESCYQFSLESSNTGWFSTPEDALDGMVNYCRASDANASNCQGSIGNCNAPGAYACSSQSAGVSSSTRFLPISAPIITP